MVDVLQAKCPYYGSCGGCQTQHIPYDQQCEDKELVLSTLYGKPVLVRQNPTPYNYRNRMDFICTPKKIGLRKTKKWDSIVDIASCPIQDQQLNAVLQVIRSWVQEYTIPCYDLHKQEGFLRYIMLRKGYGIQVTLTTTNSGYAKEIEALFAKLSVPSLIWTVNATKSDVSVGNVHKVFGDKTIPIALLGKTFSVGPHTFFQTSPQMAEQAITTMRSFVPSGGVVHDLYCGVGVLGICTHKGHVIGVDSVKESIACARKNAEQNGVDAEFFCSPVASWLAGKKIETAIVDPPRAGLGVAAASLYAAKPKRIIYLSCNPTTQKRDIDLLSRNYSLTHIEGFDFFPQTKHIECLAVLDRLD